MRKGVWKLDSIVKIELTIGFLQGKTQKGDGWIVRDIPLMWKRNNFLVSTDLGQKNRTCSPVLPAVKSPENYNADLSSFSGNEQ